MTRPPDPVGAVSAVSAESAAGESTLRALDAEARLRAQRQFDAPLVLEAGAGTGKTATLSARILAWCLGPGWERGAERAASGAAEDAAVAAVHGESRIAADVLRRVVAITFTEAAAAEMAERVGQGLREVEQGRVPVGSSPEVLDAIAGRRERARALLGVLDQLGVRTIHAFCRRLLAEHPLEAGMHPRFEVDAEERLQAAAIREVIEQALADLGSHPVGEELRRLARLRKGPPELEAVLVALVRDGVPPDAFRADPFAPDRVRAWRAALHETLALFLERAAPLRTVTAKVTSELLDAAERMRTRLASLGDGPGELLAFREACAEDWTASRLGRLATWRKGNDLTKGDAAAIGGDEAFAAAAGAFEAALRHLARLEPELLDAGRRVLAPLLEEVHGRLRQRGIATFAALLRNARDLLRAPAVASRLRRRIDQLLVDEFQDTDALQCEIIGRIALEGPESERPGLFLVGDPKQSIYGWRNADLGAYADFVERVCADPANKRPLRVNFRSTPAVLAEVERLIAPIMHAQRRVQPPFERLLACEPNAAAAPADEPAVEHWISWRWDAGAEEPAKTRAWEATEIEARALAADLRRRHDAGALAWKDVGLLFRAATDLDPYLEALRNAGIPFAVEGDRSYYQRREIVEAAAWVRAALDPHDHLALLGVLRSATVGVPDAALVPLWTREFPRRMSELGPPDSGGGADGFAALDEIGAAVARELPADLPGLDRIAGWERCLSAAVRSLADLRRSFAEEPADVFIERLRTRLLFEATEAARYLGVYRVANLDRFFRDLEGMLEDGDGDPQAVLRGLRTDVSERRAAEEGRPKDSALDAVRVLTIHKAKGLDFEHVYLLQLHRGRGGGEAPVDVAEVAPGRFEYQLLGAATLGYPEVRVERQRTEEMERVRTLYVAVTRAKRRLVIAGARAPWSSGSDQSQMALVEQRAGAGPDLESLAGALAAEGRAWRDADGARWLFPALAGFGAAPEAVTGAWAALFDPERVRATSRLLAEHRREAAARMQRALGGPASRGSHEETRDRWRDGLDPESEDATRVAAQPRFAPSEEAARQVGTAVHRVLERIDLAQPEASLPAERERAAAELERALSAAERPAARARLEELLQPGPLLASLREIGPRVVARELDVLLPPGASDDEPVGYLAGAIDLLYRDAEGAFVVADYKTDRVESAADIDAKVDSYAAQGAVYVRAVQEALGLETPPRFELWFLHAGRIEPVPPERLRAGLLR